LKPAHHQHFFVTNCPCRTKGTPDRAQQMMDQFRAYRPWSTEGVIAEIIIRRGCGTAKVPKEQAFFAAKDGDKVRLSSTKLIICIQ